jgi:hypothetical protein
MYHQQKNSNIENYSLGTVWRYLYPEGELIGNLHDSMTDVRCQSDILCHPDFLRHIN